MHTIIVLAMGFGLLGLCVLAGHLVGSSPAMATAALLLLPLWLAGAGINMYLGVKRAGYSVKEEVPMFLLVFAVGRRGADGVVDASLNDPPSSPVIENGGALLPPYGNGSKQMNRK